ncbi:hypothetical protein BC629DRAFT_1535696 [Irpex lacteus]|nr:hypothetical protein BC629DRAFT_1535696 [Irpex lacteus]
MAQPTRQLVRPRTPNESSNAGKKSVARSKTRDRSSSRKVKSAAKVKAEVVNVTKKKAKPGALQALLDMPLDVFLEICTHLQPQDLLSMARTSKELRKMSSDRKSQYLWKAARANVPSLPPYPDDFCEPAYAHLAFSTFCHHCLRRNSGRPCWQWRIRLCRPCFDTLAVGVYTSNSDLYDLLDDNVFEAWQTHWLQQRKRTDVLLPSVPVNDRHGYYSHCWYRPDVERFNKCVLEASPQDVPILLDDMERLAAARAEEATQLEKWLDTVQRTRAVEIEKLYAVRRQQYVSKQLLRNARLN